ncbi:MAG: hypothetical protein JXB03_00660 [Spirochaetales bacterium]|nr:hypothetical protein [Spirochaetales bacterium]
MRSDSTIEAMGQTFDDLAARLSKEERIDLLDKIRSSYVDSAEPLHERNYEQPNLERIYSHLSVFEKFLIFIKMLFFSRDRLILVEELVCKRFAREIEDAVPGMIDYKNKKVLPGFFRKVEELQSRASVFIMPFKELIQKGRGDFYAFLADIEAPALSQRILAECDPGRASVRRNTMEEGILRQEIENTLEMILEEMDPVDRQNMYYHARVVSALREFALYPYERILLLKEKGRDGGASFETIQPVLLDVINIIFSLEHRPRVVLLEGLFLFAHVKDMEDEQYPLESDLKGWIEKTREAMGFLRSFNTEVPLIKIYALIADDLNFFPRNITSGEDWFSLYRQFWMARLEKNLKQYLLRLMKKEVLAKAAHLIHQSSVVSVPYYSKTAFGSPVAYEKTLAFLLEFLKREYQLSMHNQLKRILIDGEFYKEQNSQDFSEGFSGCSALEAQIQNLFLMLRSDGRYGAEIEKIDREPIPQALAVRKKKSVLGRFDRDVAKVLTDAATYFHLLINVLNGILFGEKGGRFDTLSNLGYIGGKENQQFIRRLKALLDDLTNFIGVFHDLKNIEEKDANGR